MQGEQEVLVCSKENSVHRRFKPKSQFHHAETWKDWSLVSGISGHGFSLCLQPKRGARRRQEHYRLYVMPVHHHAPSSCIQLQCQPLILPTSADNSCCPKRCTTMPTNADHGGLWKWQWGVQVELCQLRTCSRNRTNASFMVEIQIWVEFGFNVGLAATSKRLLQSWQPSWDWCSLQQSSAVISATVPGVFWQHVPGVFCNGWQVFLTWLAGSSGGSIGSRS